MNLSIVLNGSLERHTVGTEVLNIGSRLEVICEVEGSELRKIVWETVCESVRLGSERHTVSCSDALDSSTSEVRLFFTILLLL